MTTATRDRIGATCSQMRVRPVPIDTAEDDIHGSFWLRLSGRWQKARSLDNLWEFSEEWWDDRPVIKMYFRVTIEDQSQLIIFQDLLGGAWYREESGEGGAGKAASHAATMKNQQAARKTVNIKYRTA